MMTFDNLIAIHAKLFPETDLYQQIAKYSEEEEEYKEASDSTEDCIYELADMIVVSAGIARFDYTRGIGLLVNAIYTSEFPIDDIWQAVEKKVEKLKKRVWVKDPDVGYKHTKGIED